MTAPTISIVIPTRDGAATLPAVLDAIVGQAAPSRIEIIAVDSGSTDGSVEILARRADTLLTVAPADFNHGVTRNLAIAAARGDLVVLLVQDAVPVSELWLAALTAPFTDGRLAGAFARQVPRPDAGRLTRWALASWVAAREEGYITSIDDPTAFSASPPMERFLTCVFDNVCSCVRREVWERHPFAEVPIAEDVAWAREVLLAGHRIAYVPAAVVSHSHERTIRSELDRTIAIHRELGRLFGLRTVPTLPALGRAVTLTVGRHLRVLASGDGPRPGPAELLRALGLAVAWPLGQYIGGRPD